jgi:predicted nucleotidyltransferase
MGMLRTPVRLESIADRAGFAYCCIMKTGPDIQRASRELIRVRELADAFAGELRALFGPRLKRIRLYGSAVRGDWSYESDVDVLVLLDTVTSLDMDIIAQKATSLGIVKNGLLIQPLVMPESEFERLKRQERRFALEVDKTGIAL